MRIVLVLLLLANLAMVVVNIYLPRQSGVVLPAALPEAQALKRVSERAPESEVVAEAQPPLATRTESPLTTEGVLTEEVLEEIPGEAADESIEAPAEPVRECFTLGPYRDGEVADAAAERIRGIGLPASRRTSVERELRSYWVLIPPQASKVAADAIADQLKARGVKDFFVTQEPANGVSLGLFSKRRYADRRVREIERLGYEVDVEPIYRERTVYWLDYETRGERIVPEQLWRGSVPQGAGVERLPRDCG